MQRAKTRPGPKCFINRNIINAQRFVRLTCFCTCRTILARPGIKWPPLQSVLGCACLKKPPFYRKHRCTGKTPLLFAVPGRSAWNAGRLAAEQIFAWASIKLCTAPTDDVIYSTGLIALLKRGQRQVRTKRRSFCSWLTVAENFSSSQASSGT